MNTVLSREAVHAYVTAVRAGLADLPPEDVEDLTGGLEADLAERAAELPEGADPTASFGSPEAYAAELRSAAGLPPFVPQAPAKGAGPGPVQRFELWMRARREELLTLAPWLRDLRPVWWLARGFVLAAFPAYIVLGARVMAVILGLIGAAVSFWWSRSQDAAPSTARNRLTVLGNVLAALLLLPTFAVAAERPVQYVEISAGQHGPGPADEGPGVWVNGEAASSLYAYDADGNRLERVRLFNQYGQAVTVSNNVWWNLQESNRPPETQVDGQPRFDVNPGVFPVRWGSRTGWEASTGGWEPPVKISTLPAEAAAGETSTTPGTTPVAPETSSPSEATKPTPSASDPVTTATPSSSTSPGSTGSTSPSPSPSPAR